MLHYWFTLPLDKLIIPACNNWGLVRFLPVGIIGGPSDLDFVFSLKQFSNVPVGTVYSVFVSVCVRVGWCLYGAVLGTGCVSCIQEGKCIAHVLVWLG